MKSNRIKLMAFGLGVLSLASCRKIENYSNIDRLVDKTWHLETITKNGEDITPICALDNSISFSKDGEAVHNFGTLTCEDDAAIESWKFTNNYQNIRFKFKFKSKTTRAVGFISREIIELTDTTLVIKEIYPSQDQEMPEITTYISL